MVGTLKRRIARSTAVVIFLSLLNVVVGPVFYPNVSSSNASAANSNLIQTGLTLDANATAGANDVASSMTFGSVAPVHTNSGVGYYTFDGTTNKYAYANRDFADGANVSIFMWVYPTATGVMLSHSGQGNPYTGYRLTMIDYTSAGKFEVGLYNSGASWLTSTWTTPLNNWYYVGLTYDGSTLRGYINGQEFANKSLGNWTTAGNDYFHIGSAQNGTCFSVTCADTNAASFRMGEFSIYTTALSAANVASNYNATQTRFAPTASAPSSISTYVNRNASFASTCTGATSNNGATSCAYQWQLSTDSGANWSDISGATSSSYSTAVFGSVVTGYQYRVRTYDPGTGSPNSALLFANSAVATLTVTQPPGSDTDTALSLNGSSQYAEVADSTGSPYDLTGSLTLEAWVKPADACAGSGAVISKNISYMMYCQAGKWMYMVLANGTSGSGAATSISVEANEWHHIAYTKSAASGNLLVYYDGYLVQTIASGVTSMTPNNNVFRIGQYTGSYTFNGQIDEVRVYNSQRSQAQIITDMKTYGSITDSDLVAYYDFNEGTGSTLYNRESGAPTGMDLTLYGSPTWSDVKTVDAISSAAYTTVTFTRSYLTSSGGWKVPAGVTQASVIVTGGGGGGGAGTASNAGPAGAGGGGGVTYVPVANLTSGAQLTVTVGQGGLGDTQTSIADDATSRNGRGSILGGYSALGGGGGGSYLSGVKGAGSGAGDTSIATGGGSSGYDFGANGGNSCYTQAAAGGVVATGYNGGSGVWGWGGSGGGARGAATIGSCANQAGIPGSGFVDPVTSIEYGRGGYGNGPEANSLGYKYPVNNGWGGSVAYNSGASSGDGYNAAAGVVIVRWITAIFPTYTKPVTAYLNVGMTETFTTNVAADSATAILTRTFKWESTTPAANGTYTLIKQGTGAANASFSWVPSDTSTTGSGYLYRLTVTDSDTAGLYITDSSTAFAVINRALSVVGTSSIAKKINLSKSETFTITLGTSTYRPTLSPTIAGITLDTSTAGLAVIKISETVTVGTYYETLTVIDSVSASVVTPLIIRVAAPPNLLNTSELVSENLALHFEAGNSASLLSDSGTVTTGLTWNDISGNKAHASTGAGVNTNAGVSTTCSAPTYSNANGGSLLFKSNNDNCYYTSYNGANFMNNFTVEAWFKTTEALNSNQGLLAQSTLPVNSPIFISIRVNVSGGLYVSYWNNLTATNGFPNCPFIPTIGTWTSIAGTYDGTTMSTYINGQLQCSAAIASYTPSGTGNTSGIIIGKSGTGATNAAFPGYIASVRMYTKSLTAAQILSNFNATKSRFDLSNNQLVTPTKKYGASLLESLTATSGLDTKTVTFLVGDRSGIDWETVTATNRVNLTMQESLTVGTFYDTVTVTDSLGQSTYLPMVMSVGKADSFTVTMGAATSVTYNGSQITVYPRATVTGLKWSDTATSLSRFSSSLYSESTVIPTNADTYTVRGAVPVFTLGSIDNYLGVIYDTSTATVTKAKQSSLNIFAFGGLVGSQYLISLQGGNGTGAVTETLTGVSTLSGCAISNHYLSASEQKQGYCEVQVVKDGDQNYFSETQTIQLYFIAYLNNGVTGTTGSGSTIGINNKVSVETSTALPPSITSLSTLTLSLAAGGTFTITGTGFTGSITIKFWRNKAISATSGNGTTIAIPVSSIQSAGATSGRIAVITAAGEAISIDSLTINP